MVSRWTLDFIRTFRHMDGFLHRRPINRSHFLRHSFRRGARFSPDGKWLAYTSNESGRFEVYVRPFHGEPASAEGKIQISQNGGDFPVWRPGGGELYYMSDDRIIYAINTKDLGRTGTAPLPARLFPPCPGRA